MQLEQSFEVDAPIDRVWRALIDVEQVAPCLPGAAVTGRNEDGTYNGTFTIKIGPTTASYTGKLEMQNLDESTHRATMHAQGSDKRGQGGATATISSKLSDLHGRTLVQVATDYHITGRLARFGRGGMIEDISERLLREFAGRLQASLTYSGAGEAAGAVGAGGEAGGAVGAGGPGLPASEPAATTGGVEQPTEETPRATEPLWARSGGASSEGAGPPTEVMPEVPGVDDEPPSPSAIAEEPSAPSPVAEEPPVPSPAAEEPSAPSPEAVPTAAPEAVETSPPPPPPEAEPPAPPPPPPPPTESAPPVEGLSLVGGVLIDRVKRNPAPIFGILGGLFLLRLLLRRR